MSRRRWRPPQAAPVWQPHGAVLLEVRGLRAERSGRLVLAGVDLTVRAGEVVALVGPNGAGKSTLLAAICGDLPVMGSVRVGGRDTNASSPAELALLRAVLPQHPAVAFPFLARDVVEMGRAPWRAFDRGNDDARIDAALAEADAAELAGRRVTGLSGGERARVALARVLAQDAQLLLLDEPTAALDIGHQELVMRALRARADAGAGVVIVLHDLSLAAAHADRLVVVGAGAIAADGPPSVVADPAVLSRVYGTPVEVLAHHRTGAPLVLPYRLAASAT